MGGEEGWASTTRQWAMDQDKRHNIERDQARLLHVLAGGSGTSLSKIR